MLKVASQISGRIPVGNQQEVNLVQGNLTISLWCVDKSEGGAQAVHQK